MYVLILTADEKTQQTDAHLITAEDWNSLPLRDRAEMIEMTVAVCQTQNGDEPINEDELLEIIKNSVQITDPNEKIL
jgi:hypothetical protein